MKDIDNIPSSAYKKEAAYFRAQNKFKALKAFYWHAFWYLAINIFILVMITCNANGNIWHFGTLSTPLFWGIGLGFHAIRVFNKNLFFNESWENRKIQEYIHNDKANRH